jgi:hypothetical protein
VELKRRNNLSQNSQHKKKNLKKKQDHARPTNVKGRHNKFFGGNSITSYFKQVHNWKKKIQFN